MENYPVVIGVLISILILLIFITFDVNTLKNQNDKILIKLEQKK